MIVRKYSRLISCLGSLLCVLVLTASGYCQGTGDPIEAVTTPPAIEKLSLMDAIAMALDVNPTIKRAQDSQAVAQSRLKIADISTTFEIATVANLARTPRDSHQSGRLLGEITYANKLGTSVSLGLAPFGYGNDRGSLGITLRHPLMRGKGVFSDRSYTLEGAHISATVQDKQYYLARQSAIQGVIQAYFRAVQAREQVKVQERAVEVAQEAADGARERAKELQVTEIEVSRAAIRVAQTRDQLNIHRQTAQGTIDRLMMAIGEGVGANPTLTDAVPHADFEVPTLAEAIERALTNRSELTVYDLQLADQERNLAMKYDRLRPRLDVVAGFNSMSDDSGVISKSLYDLGSFTAGIEYRLPVDRRSLEEDRAMTEQSLDVLRKLRVYQMEQVAESVRSAYRALEASKVSVEILSQNVKIAQDNLALAQEMLDEGLTDNRNVLEGQDALTRAESGLLSAKVDLFLASINLKYAMGEDLATIGRL